MKQNFNYLGLLSLLSLLYIMGFTTGNTGWYGFLGFLAYLRYFWVIPDELFQLNLRKACTFAFITEMISLVPFIFISSILDNSAKAMHLALALSFVVGIIAFTGYLTILEWREISGAEN